jgi:hypothetical protein
MKRFAQGIACLVAALVSLPVFGQVATVYVTNFEGTFIYEASSNGELTLTHGYLAEGDGLITGTKSYIFGGSDAHSNVDSFAVKSNGSLSQVASRDVLQDTNTDQVESLFLDRTGATLYVCVIENSPFTIFFASYSINKTNGELTYLGKVQGVPDTYVLTFTGDNKFAYTGTCVQSSSGILGFNRLSNGLLVLGKDGEAPKGKAGDLFCPVAGAADPTDHVAFDLLPLNHPGGKQEGAFQLGTFTVSSSGNVSTKSTYENMPTVAVGYVAGISMSPSGKLLAVGGESGPQLFHFNGSSPITKFTGSLGTGTYASFAWDNDNHLYAVNSTTGHVHVYTATTTEVKEVSGSPFTVPYGANTVFVIPK